LFERFFIDQKFYSVFSLLFSGLGLWWRIGAAKAVMIGVVIFAVQIPLSALWPSRFRYAPIEWIRRRLTYGHPI
jgi:uncharacterized protein